MEHLTFIYIFLWILNNIFFIAMIVIGFNISECFMIVVSVIVLKVFTFEISRQKPTTSHVVIEPIHSAGIYMVVMTSGNSTWQAKLVVE